MENNNLSINNVPSCPVKSSQVPTLKEAMEKVKAQICYESFYNKKIRCVPPQVGELCLIIAEIFTLNPEAEINIESSPMQVGLVQEIFKLLGRDHIELVINNYKKITGRIQRKKSYLRTALYNSAFELDSHYQNEFNSDKWN